MIESAFPIVEVPDMDAAMRFYHDALGTAVVYRYPADGDPVFVTLQAGASQLGLGLTENGTAGEGAGSLRVDYKVGPWNVDNPSSWMLIIPLLCLAAYATLAIWASRHRGPIFGDAEHAEPSSSARGSLAIAE